jgi:hypothetical protein
LKVQRRDHLAVIAKLGQPVFTGRDTKFDADVLAFLKATGSETQTDEHGIALAKRCCGTVGGRLSA